MEKRSKITFVITENENGVVDIVNPNIGADGTCGLNAGFGFGIIGAALNYVKEWKEKNPNINAVSEK